MRHSFSSDCSARETSFLPIAAKTTLQRFERTRVARLGRAPEGPDATFHGELEVGDPEAFVRILANGIGRHKAYGYGMLMLRPARKTAQED